MNRWTLHSVCFGALSMILGFAQGNSAQAWAEEISSQPQACGPTSYVDIDALGRILLINYTEKSATILGELDYLKKCPDAFCCAFINPERTRVYVLLDDDYQMIRLYVYSVRSKSLRATSVVFNVNADWNLVAVKNKAYIWNIGREENTQGTIVNGDTAKVEGAIAFDMRPEYWTSASDDAQTIFISKQAGDEIWVGDLRSGKLLQTKNVHDIVDFHTKEIPVYVSALSYPYVLVGAAPPNRRNPLTGIEEYPRPKFLVLLPHFSIVATSPDMDLPFNIKPIVLPSGPGSVQIVGLGQEYAKDREIPIGKVAIYKVAKDTIEFESILSYDPNTEVVLRDKLGTLRVYPKYTFDYLSASKYAGAAWEKRKDEEGSKNLLENMLKEAKKAPNVTHLTIKAR